MNTKMNGKKIKQVVWETAEGDQPLDAEGPRTLELSATYHGDHDEFWVVVKEMNREVARHNCRYIASIVWADELEEP